MTISLKHAFECDIPDGSDGTIVRPSDWNAEHVITMATDRMLGRVTAGEGGVEELTASQIKVFLDLEIGVDVQAYSANLDSWSAVNPSSYYTSAEVDTALADYVTGPASSTDNAVARYDSTTGKIIQNSGVTIDDSNNVAGVVNLTQTGYHDLAEIAEPSSPSANVSRGYARDINGVTYRFAKDSGGRNRLLTNSAFNVLEYGATGDGSTDDTTAISNAVSAANTAGGDLYWPVGSYVTSSSIPNLHSVRHFGSGVISRSGNTFEVEPGYDDANTIYVAASGGSDTNDGLSASQALATIQQAFDILENYGPILNGTWTIQLAAGTYTHTSSPVCSIKSTNSNKRVVVRGPSLLQGAGQDIVFAMENLSGAFTATETVTGGTSGATATLDTIDSNTFYLTGISGTFQAGETITGGTSAETGDIVQLHLVPTAIIDGTGGSNYDHGITFEGSIGQIQDIKFQNFDSSSDRGAIVGQNGANIYTLNIHHDGIGWFGVYATADSIGRAQGGHYNDCGNGFLCRDSQVTVGQGASSLATGPLFTNCTVGVAINGSFGHCDYAIFDNNDTGLFVNNNGRVHDVSCDFKNNSTAVTLRSGGLWANDGAEFNVGTSDANTITVDIGAFCHGTYDLLEVSGSGNLVDARSEILIGRNLNSLAHTGSTSRTVMATPYTIPGGSFIFGGATGNLIGKKLRLRISGTRSGTAGTVSLGVDFGGSEIVTLDMVGTSAHNFISEIEIWARGSASQNVLAELRHGSGGNEQVRRFGLFSRSVDMTSDVAVQVVGLLTNAADTITVKSIEVWLTG